MWWKRWSNLGGGKELKTAAILAFFLFKRPRFLYYLAIFSSENFGIHLLKLVYHEPRPYMMNSDIQPIDCDKSFGNPSNHSGSSFLFAFAVFLDIFHGKPFTKKVYSYSWTLYIMALSFAIFWAISLPYTRVLLGVHSVN